VNLRSNVLLRVKNNFDHCASVRGGDQREDPAVRLD